MPGYYFKVLYGSYACGSTCLVRKLIILIKGDWPVIFDIFACVISPGIILKYSNVRNTFFK